MKKNISLLMALVLLVTSMVACGNKESKEVSNTETKSFKIVTTIFPIYDWVKSILGDKFVKENVSILLDNSVDLHNYQPTSADIVEISNSDLFIYVGGESDEWVPDVLNQVSNTNLKTLNLMDSLSGSLQLEEEKEGMEESEEHEESAEEGEEYDEHIWLSLKNAKKIG